MAFSEAGFHASVAIVSWGGFKLHRYRNASTLDQIVYDASDEAPKEWRLEVARGRSC
jgi:hypothetical protein